jgi:hypothetical protein
MSHLVKRDDLPLLGIEQAVALLQPRDHAFDRVVEVGHGDRLAVTPSRQQCCFVHEIGKIGAGESRRQRRHRFRIDVGGEMNFLHMDFEDFDAPLLVGTVDQHLAVEAAGAQQRGVENFRPVGSGEDDEARARVETVELDQELVQRLLLLIIAARERTDAAGAAERIKLVDEDDRRRLFVRLLKQIPHPRSADADEHLDELRA